MQVLSALLAALALVLASASGQSVFINELHYDNSGADQNEGVELAGPAGTSLVGYKLVFYNGANGNPYAELPLGGVLSSQGGTASGTAFFSQAGIQNGAPDGLALIDTIANSVVQFLSYEGSFTANSGDAAGEITTDIGVSESGSTSPTESLQLVGSGAVYSDFAWQSPRAASPGAINAGQMFLGVGSPSITLTLMPNRLLEGETATANVTLFPAPADPVTITIHNPDPTELSLPRELIVSPDGTGSAQFSALDDALNDGSQLVVISASDTAGFYQSDTASARVLDRQRPQRGTGIRLATLNVLNGVGASGSPAYEALRALVDRLEPDVIAFQEVSSAGDFFDLRELLADLGIQFLATTDDDFIGQPYEGGRFNNDQNLAIASIYPITSTRQIDRARDERKELTRFPLMVDIDVPGTGNDPTVVAVHYKASPDDASRFRRAVAAYRTLQELESAGKSGTSDNLFVLGDFNEDNGRFMPLAFWTGIDTANHVFADGSRLPATYELGEDLSAANAVTLPYAQFPDNLFGTGALVTPPHRQQDNRATRTFITFGDAALDYILHSQKVASNGNLSTEIFNSSLDAAFDGLDKQAAPIAALTSFAASDHFAIFGDYELDPHPTLSMTITPFGHSENAGPSAATGTLELSLAPAQDTRLSLTLRPLRADSPVSLPVDTLTFAPGETRKSFPIDIVDRRSADPDRTVTISATAPGYSAATGRLQVFNLEPSGQVLISQYTEPPSGSSPRGIELFNCSATDFDLRATPLSVVQYTNGSTSGTIEATASEGVFPSGGVVVIGDASLGDYLVSQGLLAPPDTPFASAPNGTTFLDASGDVVFVKEFFPFNGDDALELQFAFGLSDVFGTIGEDPGSAWQSAGVSTSSRNLSLRPDVATASAGFAQPHLRFEDSGAGDDLSGFGIAPPADDPFKFWMRGFGIDDSLADSDCDGAANLVEFATGTDPTLATSVRLPLLGDGTLTHHRLSSPGRLRYSVESSSDLKNWQPAGLQPADEQAHGDGTDTVTYQLPSGTRLFFRLKVSLD